VTRGSHFPFKVKRKGALDTGLNSARKEGENSARKDEGSGSGSKDSAREQGTKEGENAGKGLCWA
jgi:hypothetical protein